MRPTPLLLISLVAFLGHIVASNGTADDDDKPHFRLDRRLLWSTSKVKGSPEPPSPYRTTPAFPKLKFDEPLDMTSAPGTDKLFVAGRYGKIYSFPNEPDAEKANVLIDLKKTVIGLAFHPNFAENRQCYITYLKTNEESPLGTRVARFTVSRDEPLRIDPASEHKIIEWRSGGHNGGCLKFGPDGYLYIATGDSSGIADEYQTGQDLTNVSAAILRIDVDRSNGDDAYTIPADNPFVDVAEARGEIYAYGLRQPWKMTFDRATGDFWTGNVGQDLWEQIFLVVPGGNYGWSVLEGSYPFRPERPRGPTPFELPIVEHDHAEFRSITGGYVYHGSRLPELKGAYIYGDYDSGMVWMFRYNRETKEVTEHRELVDSTLRLVGFAEDHAGELFLVDHMRGQIFRLEQNPAFGTRTDFPRKLSETGLFTDVAGHRPAEGVIPYSVNAPQWVDGASKQRFLALPGDSQIEFDGITYPQPAPGAPHGWKFPDGTVALETITLDLGDGQSRRLETRLLHYEKLAGDESVGDQFWRGYTYVWNDDQTDAVLLDEPLGRDETFIIADPSAPGGRRQQTWHYPGRTECIVCHNMAAKYVLGINTLQMNREHDYGDLSANQIQAFNHLKLFATELPAKPAELPKLVDPHDPAYDINYRARSYLHANCSHCHRKWGGGNAQFLLLASVPREDMGIVGVKPAHGGFYIPDAKILTEGRPSSSVLLYRVAKMGPGRMPRLGSSVVDNRGVALLDKWIDSMSRDASSNVTAIAELPENASDAEIDELLGTTSGAIELVRLVDSGRANKKTIDAIVARGVAHAQGHIRDLFERYLPEEKRTKRLGAVIKPDEILALPGDVERGRQQFFENASVQCKNCHKIGGQGTEVGPDLSQIGKKYTRAKILDNILHPSREIDPKYRVQLVQTADGQVLTGLVVERTPDVIVLKDAKNRVTRVAVEDVEQIVPQQQSMMPDLLLRDMTASQVADLTAFLSSLKGQ